MWQNLAEHQALGSVQPVLVGVGGARRLLLQHVLMERVLRAWHVLDPGDKAMSNPDENPDRKSVV